MTTKNVDISGQVVDFVITNNVDITGQVVEPLIINYVDIIGQVVYSMTTKNVTSRLRLCIH